MLSNSNIVIERGNRDIPPGRKRKAKASEIVVDKKKGKTGIQATAPVRQTRKKKLTVKKRKKELQTAITKRKINKEDKSKTSN